ncbi:MAG TPA: alpha/beta hydrolase [Dokdonella sp.]|uniref:alpha/beta fold hydrolase n=1 Tax=Dokdonella sp. TaxID=2291710 RepID=UPI002BBE2518|nr:alpha/beta hydrolase [Dokdonella sp.]HUD41427.1 alpha/beta hydrolase [Dokdonella sp.]
MRPSDRPSSRRRRAGAALLAALALAPLAAVAETEAPPLPAAEAFRFESQNQTLTMRYRDVAPTAPANGRTALLLHGKNFCADYWRQTAATLAGHGFRVIVPEQIGFCASDKPERYHFSLHQLAANTQALLAKLGVERAELVGHSMGGMLALRYALLYPQTTARLVLVNPIGLEDWKAKGAPYRSIDAAYAAERKSSYESIARYQRANYYDGDWKPAYEALARGLAAVYAGPDGKAYAWNAALTSDMIYTQPVVYEFERIAVPTTLIIGQRDRTAIGREGAPPAIAKALGDYPALGREAARRIPGARLIEMPGLGHLPQIEAPDRFRAELLKAFELAR